MSATEELRRLLDDRGVEWEAWNDCITVAPPSTHYLEVSNGTLCVAIVDATPEQAVEATLGPGTCRNASKVMDEHGQARFACSECGAWIDLRMLWNPEYRNGESPWVNNCKLNYCPNCGAKVVE